MAAEDFFSRWAKAKADSAPQAASVSTSPDAGFANSQLPEQGAETPAKSLPTLEDVAGLTHDSDYSPFLARGVDEAVKRSAMKKLFSDPHFNVMDGLDIYIDNYNVFEPISSEMLASLNHAKALLDPLAQFEKPLMRLLEKAHPVGGVSEEESRQKTSEAPSANASEPESVVSESTLTKPEKPALSVAPSSLEPLASREADAAPAVPADRTDPA